MQRYSFSIALRIWHPNIDPAIITGKLGLQPSLKIFSRKTYDLKKRQTQNMPYFIGLVLFASWLGSASALTPPLDNSPSFFSGEWAGTGEELESKGASVI